MSKPRNMPQSYGCGEVRFVGSRRARTLRKRGEHIQLHKERLWMWERPYLSPKRGAI